MKIAVFGIGYVGLVSSACFARMGHQVIGVDIDPKRVELLCSGTTSLQEPGVEPILQESLKNGNLRFTADPIAAVKASDIALICVGTPGNAQGGLDLAALSLVSQQIGESIITRQSSSQNSSKQPFLIVVRSSVLPGTTEDVVVPALESASQGKEGQDFLVCVHPEFLRQGSALADFANPPLAVVGANDNRAFPVMESLYSDTLTPSSLTFQKMTIRAAELVKYACNAFHGLKVSFANEIGSIARAHHVDGQEVMRVFCQDTRLNISAAYLLPGGPFGGSCLTKDIQALATHAERTLEIQTPVLAATLESNVLHSLRVTRRVLDACRRSNTTRIGILGLCYKAGTDDLRDSPMLGLLEILLSEGKEVHFFDPATGMNALEKADEQLVAKHLPTLTGLRCHSLEELVTVSDVIVLAKRDKALQELAAHLQPEHQVIDLVRGVLPEVMGDQYEGICW